MTVGERGRPLNPTGAAGRLSDSQAVYNRLCIITRYVYIYKYNHYTDCKIPRVLSCKIPGSNILLYPSTNYKGGGLLKCWFLHQFPDQPYRFQPSLNLNILGIGLRSRQKGPVVSFGTCHTTDQAKAVSGLYRAIKLTFHIAWC